MKRFWIAIFAVLVTAAAPARAWCEATCLAPPSEAATPHCAASEPADDGPAITGGAIDDCPVVESARPSSIKIEFVASTSSAVWHLAPMHLGTPAHRDPGTQAPRHLVKIPLRI